MVSPFVESNDKGGDNRTKISQRGRSRHKDLVDGGHHRKIGESKGIKICKSAQVGGKSHELLFCFVAFKMRITCTCLHLHVSISSSILLVSNGC